MNNDTGIALQSRPAAQRLLNRFGWSLLDADELAQRAAALPGTADHACLQVYAAELHRIITGNDRALIEEAFVELWRYLLPLAQRKTQVDQAEEFAQRTLVIVWEKRAQCRRSASFLGWATLILINEIRQERRKETRPTADADDADATGPRRVMRVELMEDLKREDAERELQFPADTGPVNGELARQQAYQRLLETLQVTLRSPQQIAVIVALFLEERNPIEIAEELDCTVHNIYVLKSRAMKRLKGHPGVMTALADLVEAFPQSVSKGGNHDK